LNKGHWLSLRGIAGTLPNAVRKFHATRAVGSHAHRAAAYGVSCVLSSSELKAWFAEQEKRCFWCGVSEADWHIDHFMPMSKGGPHHPDNLVISCAKCNLSKNASDPIVFADRFGLPADFERYERVVSLIGGHGVLRHYSRPIIFRLEVSPGRVLEGCSDFALANSVLQPIYTRYRDYGLCHFVVISNRGALGGYGGTWRVLISDSFGAGMLGNDGADNYRVVTLPSVHRSERLVLESNRAQQLAELAESVRAKELADERRKVQRIVASISEAESANITFRVSFLEKTLLEKYGYSLSGHIPLFGRAFVAASVSGGCA
jgi:hypothetical protein